MNIYCVTYDNGDHYVTSMNATLDEARSYFLGNVFVVHEDESTGKEMKRRVVQVESVDVAAPDRGFF